MPHTCCVQWVYNVRMRVISKGISLYVLMKADSRTTRMKLDGLPSLTGGVIVKSVGSPDQTIPLDRVFGAGVCHDCHHCICCNNGRRRRTTTTTILEYIERSCNLRKRVVNSYLQQRSQTRSYLGELLYKFCPHHSCATTERTSSLNHYLNSRTITKHNTTVIILITTSNQCNHHLATVAMTTKGSFF
jgi:hypothetical protein